MISGGGKEGQVQESNWIQSQEVVKENGFQAQS